MNRIFCFLLLSSVAVAGPLVESFDEAKQLALKLESVPENKQHQTEVLIPHFSRNYTNVLKQCFSLIPQPDKSNFEFVVAIGSTGQVMRIYNDRDTNVSECMFAELKVENFPAPIVIPYYLHIDMNFAE